MRTRFLGLFVLLLLSQLLSAQKQSVLKLNDTVPDFQFKDENDRMVSLSDFKGKVVLVDFFVTWCGPCRQELPLVEDSVWEKYKDNPNFKLLVFGRGHTKKEIEKFRAASLYSMPMISDLFADIYHGFAKEYIPRIYIIDKQGILAYASVGFDKKEFKEMLEVLDKLIKQ